MDVLRCYQGVFGDLNTFSLLPNKGWLLFMDYFCSANYIMGKNNICQILNSLHVNAAYFFKLTENGSFRITLIC
ncbi:hypothetical protein TTHERM_000672188 (macronuclear) [Tetrahymena thermophila SB210]|uniref:Uncharacterized protein n=1 Tax=Tetrahymena thermophila (strain SB210) TaxID=312017 RepID=W7XIE8_TETTS|nr:hypothetical protein TTHERM_000672188 [Tetrahymena thermophila SB210]EWS74576.1 hypothetical protein TTHERM_000672188 [Tetrahymena thermophila SB210]|eukprot:XP_012652877.1 hypothetical protein TTHERM_000672188 [Tetrahymena thermophila SB210]